MATAPNTQRFNAQRNFTDGDFAMQTKLETKAGKALDALRKVIVEPVSRAGSSRRPSRANRALNRAPPSRAP
jgi:hypothetical protein